MEIAEAVRGGVAVLSLKGRVDASTAPAFETRLLGIIGGTSRVVVDCSQLDYISSAGLRVLLVAAKRLHATNGHIALASLKDPIKEVFDIAGFASVLQIFRTGTEAVAALREG